VSLVGCSGPHTAINGVEVLIANEGVFPASLAGTWKAKNSSGWEITLLPDGTISSAVISLGGFRIIPGQTAKIPMKSKKESVIVPGLWHVYYKPEIRRLTVVLEQERIHVEIGDGVIEGKLTDVIDGIVSSDSMVWSGTWTIFLDAKTTTPEVQNFDMSTDPEYGESQEITLVKVEDG
ncbi:MAG: hypothetical protein WC380_10710, partial [Pedobacter sp.]